jgi:hypothetical protein
MVWPTTNAFSFESPMSTAPALSLVKQTLLEIVQRQLVPALEQIVRDLPDALTEFGPVENQLRARFLELARLALERWAEVADKSMTRPSCGQCGMPMRHKGQEESRLVTTLGSANYRRPRWRCETCHEECHPHDALLRFLSYAVSWPLAQVVSRLGAQVPFEQARDNLVADYGVPLAKQTITDITEAAGGHVLQQEDAERQQIMAREQPLPESPLRPDKACVFADGTKMHAAGDWHEIRVATVTAEDGEGKQLARQSRARFLPVEEIGWVLLLLARSVGYQHARLRAFVADGAPWLWNLARQWFGSAVQILDWYHLTEHVHKAANLLFGEGTTEAAAWAKRLKDALWEGKLGVALAALHTERTRVRSPAKRDALDDLERYLDNNRERIDYPSYRARGLPVGSGQVEAQCKSLVGARCKLAGMRNWTYAGAEGVLRMRAALQDASYQRLWQNRLRPAA